MPDTLTYEVFRTLYINITNQCSANCVFCIRHIADGVYGYNLRLSKEPSEEDIIYKLETLDLQKYKEVVFTGFGEPTCRLNMLLFLIKWLQERGAIIRLDTNGHAALMHPGRNVVAQLKEAGLHAVSVSLNAESEEKYVRLCNPLFSGAYQALIDFSINSVKAGIQTRMTVVGHADIDIDACQRIAVGIGATFKVR
mgnify:FL=1